MQPQAYAPQPAFNPNQGQDKKRKIVGAIILVGILIIVAAVVVAVLVGSGGSKQLGLLSARQSEAIRILDEYSEHANSGSAKHLMARASAVLKSDLNELNRVGVAASSDQQQAAVIPGIDEVMSTAIDSGRVDEVLGDYLTETIGTNLQLAEETLGSIKNENLKSVLQTVIENYKNLL